LRIEGLRYTPKKLWAQRREEFMAEKKAKLEAYNGPAGDVNAYLDSPCEAAV
jgi:hypothetical protein